MNGEGVMMWLTCGFSQRRRTRSDLIRCLKADLGLTERRGLVGTKGLDEKCFVLYKRRTGGDLEMGRISRYNVVQVVTNQPIHKLI